MIVWNVTKRIAGLDLEALHRKTIGSDGAAASSFQSTYKTKWVIPSLHGVEFVHLAEVQHNSRWLAANIAG